MTDYTIQELEQKIMDGGNVSTSEMADAMRNAEASDRILGLQQRRINSNSQALVEQLRELKKQAARGDLTPFELLSIGNAINELEEKINATNK
jgi:methionyl-tRNA formyltransferase